MGSFAQCRADVRASAAYLAVIRALKPPHADQTRCSAGLYCSQIGERAGNAGKCLEHACCQSTSDLWTDSGRRRPSEPRFAIGQDAICNQLQLCQVFAGIRLGGSVNPRVHAVDIFLGRHSPPVERRVFSAGRCKIFADGCGAVLVVV